jgi:hypothetical protein
VHFQEKSWYDGHDAAIPLAEYVVNRLGKLPIQVLPAWPISRQEAQNCDASSVPRKYMSIIVTFSAALQLVWHVIDLKRDLKD